MNVRKIKTVELFTVRGVRHYFFLFLLDIQHMENIWDSTKCAFL
jgi:hypothetical protein